LPISLAANFFSLGRGKPLKLAGVTGRIHEISNLLAGKTTKSLQNGKEKFA